MPGARFLRGDRLALHTVTDADVEFLHRHWNDERVRHGFARYEPRTPEDFRAFLDADDHVDFLVCRDGEDGPEPVGFCWLFGVDDVASRAELGYWVRPGDHGDGYGAETAELAVRYAFEERGLDRLQARVFETNDASRRVLEAVGFQHEGRLRSHYYVDGDHVDADVYGLLAGER